MFSCAKIAPPRRRPPRATTPAPPAGGRSQASWRCYVYVECRTSSERPARRASASVASPRCPRRAVLTWLASDRPTAADPSASGATIADGSDALRRLVSSLHRRSQLPDPMAQPRQPCFGQARLKLALIVWWRRRASANMGGWSGFGGDAGPWCVHRHKFCTSTTLGQRAQRRVHARRCTRDATAQTVRRGYF